MAARDAIILSVLDDSLHTPKCVWTIKKLRVQYTAFLFICSRAQFVRESLTSPTSILFCAPLERSPEFHNSSTSASCTARQPQKSLEPDHQGVKLLRDLKFWNHVVTQKKKGQFYLLLQGFPLACFTAGNDFAQRRPWWWCPSSTQMLKMCRAFCTLI